MLPRLQLVRPVSGYRVEVTCPRCGGALEHVTSSTPYRADSDRVEWYAAASAITRCPERHGTWMVRVSMTPAGNDGEAEQKRRERR